MTAASESATSWEVLWSDTGRSVAAIGAYVESADIGLSPTPGTAYAVAVASTCATGGLGVRSDTTGAAIDIGIASLTTRLEGAVSGTLAVGESVTLTPTSGGAVLDGRVTVALLE